MMVPNRDCYARMYQRGLHGYQDSTCFEDYREDSSKLSKMAEKAEIHEYERAIKMKDYTGKKMSCMVLV